VPDETAPSGEILIHCAGIAHVHYPDESLVWQANHQLAVDVARWARSSGCRHFIFLSSALVWDQARTDIDTAADIPKPDTVYGQAKLAAERDIAALEAPDFRVTVIRLPLVYGPGVQGNLEKMIRAVVEWPVCPIGSKTANRSVVGTATITRFIRHCIDGQIAGTFALVDTPAISTFDMLCTISGAVPSPALLIPAPAWTQSLLGVFRSALARRLFSSRVIHDTSVVQAGFDPIVSRERLTQGFSHMVRTYLIQHRGTVTA